MAATIRSCSIAATDRRRSLTRSNGDNVLRITGYTASDVTVRRVAPDQNGLVLSFAGSNDQITLNYDANHDGVTQIVFGDGTTISQAQLFASVIGAGTSGDDLLAGTSADEGFDGGPGNDTIIGGGGNDTYVFNRGDGQDTITSNGAADGKGIVQFGAGISESDIIATRDASGNVVLSIAGTNDSVTLVTPTAGWNAVIAGVSFADGTNWSYTDIAQSIAVSNDGDRISIPSESGAGVPGVEITGGDGNDLIRGGNGNDILIGGEGDDTLSGGPGSDSYYFSIGDGQDTIIDNGGGPSNETNRLVFGAGIAPGDVSFSDPNGKDLVIKVGAGNDRVTIKDMFDNPADVIEQFVFAGGAILTASEALAATQAVVPSNTGTPVADAAADFSLSSNPNGAWSYGEGIGGSSFTPFTITGSVSGSVQYWQSSASAYQYGVPLIGENLGSVPVTYSSAMIPGNAFIMHPGQSDDAITRWTANTAGDYDYSGSFSLADTNPSGVIGEVFDNGQEIYSGVLTGPGASFPSTGQSEAFQGNVYLNAGDTLSFVVNNDGWYGNDTTAVTARISLVTTSGVLPDLAPVGLILQAPGLVDMPTSIVGSANAVSDDEYQLTPDEGGEAGAIWGQADLSNDITWNTQMYFGANAGGADGLSFALQNAGPDALGDAGGGSLGALVPGSIGIAFDTYSNPGEPNSNFVQFILNGNRDDTSFDPFHPVNELEDAAWHDVEITWTAATSTLTVSIDGVAIASKSYDAVDDLFGGQSAVYYGFGAGTGGASNDQRVRTLDMTSTVPVDYLSVAHDAAAGTIVGGLQGVDPNVGDTFSYSIVDANGQAVADPVFEIVNGDELAVKANAVYDDPGVTSHILTILVTDAAGATYETPVTIQYDVPTGPAVPTQIPQTILGTTGNDDIVGSNGDSSLSGGYGNDTIRGGDDPLLNYGNDTFDGGPGDDVLYGGRGDDTYIFNRGDGNDTIYESGGSNTIAFGAGIGASDIVVSQVNGTDIRLTLDNGDGSITIKNVLGGDPSAAIQHVVFADGTSWQWSDVVAMSQQGGAGDDVLQAVSLPVGDPAVNLVYNGGFENFTPGAYVGLAAQSVPGWVDANNNPIYIGSNSSGWFGGGDGTYSLNLNNYGVASDISQQIANLTAGEALLLQFDHAGYYGSVEVYWNYHLVDTVTDYRPALATDDLFVTAQDGVNTLRFVDIPQGYYAGQEAIDNVQLYSFGSQAPVYGDGTAVQNGDILANPGTSQAGVLYDAVEASAAAIAPNLIVNGTFQTPDPLTDGSVSTSNVPGWADANGTPFQIQSDTTVPAQDGQYLYVDDGSTDMDISQTISDLSSGQALLLRFDYAAQYNTTGSFNVYWNGDLVATVDAADQSFRTGSYLLQAQGWRQCPGFRKRGPGAGRFLLPVRGAYQRISPGRGPRKYRGGAQTQFGHIGARRASFRRRRQRHADGIRRRRHADRREGRRSAGRWSGGRHVSVQSGRRPGHDCRYAGLQQTRLRRWDRGGRCPDAEERNGCDARGRGHRRPGRDRHAAGFRRGARFEHPGGRLRRWHGLDVRRAGGDGTEPVRREPDRPGRQRRRQSGRRPGRRDGIGGGSDDTLLGGPGNDLLEGGQGDDTYVVGSGGGQTVIDDAGGWNDTLSFDASVSPSDVSVRESSNGANLIFTIAGSASRVEIENAWTTGRIENIVFADGTSWSTQDILTHLATPGNDVIVGDGAGDETLAGGPGNDYLSSGGGYNNTNVFNYGDGQDTIGGTFANSGDTLEISGYTQDEVTFSRLAVGSSDVIVSFANTSDQILLENELDNTGVSSVQLTGDGTVYTVDDIRTAVLAAESTDGDDTIIGTDGGNETIDGGTGNDLIISGTSNETFLYRQGDGDDRIVLSAPDGHGDGTKTLDLLNYNASDLASVSRASANSDDLVLTFKNSGDRITLVSALGENNDAYYTFTISFQDGTVWTRDDMRQQVVNFADTTGNDIVNGDFDSYSWSNGSLGVTFNGNSGDDQLIGGGQGDTFIFAKGDGNDTITENNTNGYGNTVQFAGINSTDVSAAWEYKGSTTVVLSYLGDSADSVTIVNALATDGSGIQTYQFADGVTWDKTALRAVLSNAPPVATDDGYFSAVAGQPDSISVATLLSNDFDPNGDTISIVSVDGGADGTASLDGLGNVLYTANTGFVGATTFQYTITDGNGGVATASVNIRVRPPAAAVDDTGFTVAEDGSLNISAARLLSNDPGGEDNVVGSVLDPVHGAVSISSNGNILFTPDLNYRGPAQFSYISNTPDGGAAQANVYITVTPVDHNPIAVNDGPLATLENQAFTIDPTTLLANDSDVDSNPFTLTSVTSSADLQVVLNDDGTITATPNDYFYGSTFFEYTITGPSGLSSTASVAVTVTKRSLPPVAVNDVISTFHDAPILENSPIIVDSSQLLANDTDHDGNTVTVSSVSNAVGGSATLLENATVLFIPNVNFSGNASFDYTISDGVGGSATATATVVYQHVNQQPVAQKDSYQSEDPELQRALQGQEDTPLAIPVTELLKNDYDIESDTITFQSAGNADHGTLTISGGPATALDAGGDVALTPNSTITYTPDAGYYGDAFFSYVISDPQGAIGAGRVTLNFAPDQADAPPIANTDSFTLFEDIPLTIDISTLLSNDASADGGPLTFVGWYQDPYNPLIGSIKTDDNGNLVYTPFLNWFGDTHFFYTVEDDNGHTASAEVDLTVLNVPHDPTAVDLDGFVTPLDVPLVIPVAGILKQDYSVDDFTAPGVWLQPDPNLSFVGVDGVDHGQASVVTANGEQYIVVTEDPGYTGPIKVTYRIADVDGLQGIGFLNATVETTYSGELDGTEGNDLLIGNNTNEIIKTFDGTDTVQTGDGNNTVYLGSGNDTVTTGAGDDVVYTGTGNSVISTGGGDDTIFEAAGADQINGGAGFNTVDYSASHTGVNVDLEARIGRLGDAQGDIYRNIQSVVGSKYDDTLRADDNGDQLSGGDGNDLLIGGAGADTLLGGAGDDTLVGGSGPDLMYGGTGDNTVDYSGSNAAVSVDLAAGTTSGGYADGDALLNIQNVIGSAFDDMIIGDDEGDLLVGGDGDDTLLGGAGDDTLIGGAGADVLDGGDGINTVDYSNSSAGVDINLATGTASGGDADGDTLTNIQNVIGSNYDDVLTGDDSDNVFIGGAGADTIDGGGGVNTVSYATSNAAVSVDLATGLGSGGDAEGDVLSNIQVLIGSNYTDTLIGTDGNDTLRGGLGNDMLMGGAGSDTYLFGLGDGADTIIETASATDVNRIVLDPDITVHDVSVEQVGNDMVLVFENQGEFLTDSITVKDQFLDDDSGIQQVVFADGTIWDRATLAQRSLEGVLNAQDDVVYGTEELTSIIDPMSLFTNDVTGSTAGLTLLSVQDAVNGTVSIDANGQIDFTGDPLYHGDAYFTYTVADAYGRQSTARVQVNLASTNHPPVAIDHSGLTGLEDTVLDIPFSVLLQGATDPDNDTLTVVDGAPLLDASGNPIAPYSESGHFTGTDVAGVFKNNAVLGVYVELDIAPDYYGFAGFQYEVSDGNGGFDWANEEIQINHVNQAPRAGDKNVEKFTIRLGEVNVLTLSQLLASAFDPDGDPFHFVDIHDAVSGTMSYDATAAAVSFTAAALGQASFQFDLADIYNATSTITVDLTVIPEFDPPIARDDSGFTGLENQALVIDPALLLANDSDPNGDTIILQSVGRFAQDGFVSINSSGQIVYIPRTNYNGAASFTYQILPNSHGGVAQATVSLNITPVDLGATLHDDIVEDVQDQPLTILPAEAFGNDVDPLGAVLFFGGATVLGQLATKYLSRDVQFSALTVRGKALPDWLSFDASTMTFTGVMPSGTTSIDVEVKTFDPDNGNSFVHYFTFTSDDAVNLAAGLSVEDKVMTGYAIRGDFSDSFDYGWTGVGQTVSVGVTMADGSALPAWLAFDPATLTLVGAAPAGTVPFAVLATYSYLDPTSGATLLLRRDVVVDPSTVGAGIELNAHVAALTLGAGTWDAHLAGNQPLPEWLDFDPTAHTLAFSDFAPAAGATPARIDIDFTPTPVALPNGTYASSQGGFTIEFVIDPNAPLDPAIGTILANSAYFADQNEFGIDLAHATSVTALLSDGNPLPDWLSFDPATLRFSGSPPPEYTGAIPVRLDVVGNGVDTPDFSILTDVVVDPTFTTLQQNVPTADVTPDLLTLNSPIPHDNGSIAVQYTTVDEQGTASVNAATDVVNIAPQLVPIRTQDASYGVVQGHSVSFTLDDVLANDRDDNGDPFRVISFTQPADGTLVETGAQYSLAPPASLIATATSSFSATLADGTAVAGLDDAGPDDRHHFRQPADRRTGQLQRPIRAYRRRLDADRASDLRDRRQPGRRFHLYARSELLRHRRHHLYGHGRQAGPGHRQRRLARRPGPRRQQRRVQPDQRFLDHDRRRVLAGQRRQRRLPIADGHLGHTGIRWRPDLRRLQHCLRLHPLLRRHSDLPIHRRG